MINLLSAHKFSIISNPNVAIAAPFGAEQLAVLNEDGLQAARREILSWPGYEPTPLIALSALAKAASVASVFYKDEGWRFGLGSFKPLGGAYAVFRIIEAEIRKEMDDVITSADLFAGKHHKFVNNVTVCAATDGNHGRSVAWGAQMFGCRCVIYINEAVSVGRERAIALYGAEVHRNAGSFDDAVCKASEVAGAEGWHIVPDTSAGRNDETARNITQGYTVLADELVSQVSDEKPPSHLFIQAGVGGLAAATTGQLWQAYGKDRPITVIVEPPSADCWFESLKTGKPVVVDVKMDSLMAGLACGEPSPLAWSILKTGAHAAMTIPDEAAAETMRLLAEGIGGDRQVVGGESGVAGLAAFLLSCRDDKARNLLQIDEASRIVAIGSEGDTDPTTYREIVGRSGDEIRALTALHKTI